MAYYVYILYSETFDRFYKGQTGDLEDRLRRHNNGIELSTKAYRPWILVWYTTAKSRSEAMRLERKLKHLNKAKTRRFVIKYPRE
ncbi:MAG: GIY-YIG nuclease family protein [Maribacter sp.]|nr:GIY-YIG nuclease family protein [Maribacter sp.]